MIIIRYRIILYVLLLIFALLFSGCPDDDYFGRSDFNEILEFSVSGQSGVTSINSDESTVTLSVASSVDRSELAPDIFEVSNFAEVTPGRYEARDFTVPVEYTVTSESGLERIWTVIINETGENPQLENSDFDLWYETSAGLINPIYYEEPGESEDNTVWATANYGLTNYGSSPNTTPVDMGDDNFAAKIITVRAPAIVPLAAGTLFTGRFVLNIINPSKSAVFGTPFTDRPAGFMVYYMYVPGDETVGVDADECDIYVLLEKRDGDNVARVATGWFRDGTDTGADEWILLEVDLKYGELTSADPEFEYANIKSGETWADPDETPTHIIVVFSSSARGDIYEGAIGSTLYVDDFELVY